LRRTLYGQFLILLISSCCHARKSLCTRAVYRPATFHRRCTLSIPTEDIMLARELATSLGVMAFVLLLLVFGSARLDLTARTEHIARLIGARMFG
jgi:hypothetical protein